MPGSFEDAEALPEDACDEDGLVEELWSDAAVGLLFAGAEDELELDDCEGLLYKMRDGEPIAEIDMASSCQKKLAPDVTLRHPRSLD